jgi:hypothetical protein
MQASVHYAVVRVRRGGGPARGGKTTPSTSGALKRSSGFGYAFPVTPDLPPAWHLQHPTTPDDIQPLRALR